MNPVKDNFDQELTGIAGKSIGWIPLEGRAYLHRGDADSTVVFDAASISINSAPMSSSGSVRLRYEKCLEVWGNAVLSRNKVSKFIHAT
jgi:hypothetical protein